MKNIMLIFITLFLVPTLAFSQNKSLDKFYKKYKHLEGSQKIKLPGMLFKVGSKVGKNHVETEEEKATIDLVKSIRKMRSMIVEDAHKIPRKDVKKLVQGMKSEAYEELISIHAEGTRINIMIRGDELSIKNLMFIMSEEDQLIIMDMKLKLKYDDINQLINLMREDMELEIETPEDILPEEEDTEHIRA